MDPLSAIEDNFAVILAMGFVFGLAAPSVFSQFNPYILWFLIGVMFFTILKIDLRELARTAANPAYVLYLSILILGGVPVLCYGIASTLFPAVAAGTLIACALPAAVSSTSITLLLKGNPHIALLVTIITALVVPFTLPALVKALIGVETAASYGEMFTLLVKVIVVPFALALAAKRVAPSAIERTKRAYPTLNVFLLFFVIAGPVGQYADIILGDLGKTGEVVAFFVGIAVLRHLIGWYASFWRPFPDRIASTTVVAYCNIGLGIGFAYDFFSPEIVVVVVLYEVVWNVMPVPFQHIVKSLSLKGKYS